jgi:hypothetical protein
VLDVVEAVVRELEIDLFFNSGHKSAVGTSSVGKSTAARSWMMEHGGIRNRVLRRNRGESVRERT